MRAAEAIGDDTLQKQTQGRVVPESFTHGSSAQRQEALRRGLSTGNPASCNYARYARLEFETDARVELPAGVVVNAEPVRLAVDELIGIFVGQVEPFRKHRELVVDLVGGRGVDVERAMDALDIVPGRFARPRI